MLEEPCVVPSLGREHTSDMVRAWRMGDAASRPCVPSLWASLNVLWDKRFWSLSHSPKTVPGNYPVVFVSL